MAKNNPNQIYSMTTTDGQTNINECTEEKDLGVTFDNRLNFNSHINNVITKAYKVLGVIKRSFSYLDEEVMTNLYKTLVRPHLEYGNLIWYPSITQSADIERVQRRATKMIPTLKGLNYEDRLKRLKLPTLKHRRKRGDIIQVFKIINKIDDLKQDIFFEPTPLDKTRSTGAKLYVKGNIHLNLRKNVFSNRIVSVWNSLPANTKCSTNLNIMKNSDQNFNNTRYDYDGRKSVT
jgi:ribonuclease P/MRP protein subunit RPP40